LIASVGPWSARRTTWCWHLSGHGCPGAIVLEDEDGGAIEVDTRALADVLGRAGVPVPLVVLSTSQSAGAGSDVVDGFAAGLVTEGLDRVVAMQTEVTDCHATAFAAGLYRRLAPGCRTWCTACGRS
jgi:CHAT domain-containing protein